jgi:hypothetical protein
VEETLDGQTKGVICETVTVGPFPSHSVLLSINRTWPFTIATLQFHKLQVEIVGAAGANPNR